MIRFCIRQAVRVFAGAAFFACALSAQAANFTFNDPNCASFTLTGSAGNYTLACASLSCSISSSAGLSPQPGINTTLTATCSPAAATYAWTPAGGNDPACPVPTADPTKNTWFVPAPLSGGNPITVSGCTYQVAATSATQGNGSASTSVSWSNVVVTKPSQCSITANQNPLPAGGGTVTLTASCAGGSAVDSWTNWTGPTTTVSGNTATASLTQAASFTVTANNSGGSTTTPSFTENVATAGGGGGGAISCSGFNATTVLTEPWTNWTTNTAGNMGPNDALVVKFTTGPTASSQAGKIVMFSGSGQDSAHDAFVSTTPCDFTTPTLLPDLKFTIGTKIPLSPMLALNTTYYINIRNSAGAICLSPTLGVSCSMAVSLYKPANLN